MLISECMCLDSSKRPTAQEVVIRLEALVPLTAAQLANSEVARSSLYALLLLFLIMWSPVSSLLSECRSDAICGGS